MFESIWQDVQQQFRSGTRVTQIILVNLAVFILVNILRLITLGIPGSDAYTGTMHFLELSNDWVHNLTHPWTLLTYGFLHEGFWHIGWNMLLFYWFGRIVGDLIGDDRILPIYLWGALAGGLLFWATAAFMPYGAGGTLYLLGASGAVMATIVAAAVIAPEYAIRLILLGEVRLKYIALVLVLLDVFAFGNTGNQGGHFAHIGGALMGYFFVAQLQSGRDLAVPVNRVFDATQRFFGSFRGGARRPRRRPTIAYRRGEPAGESNAPQSGARPRNPDTQERLDVILEKIKAAGIESLSPEERDFLYQASRERS